MHIFRLQPIRELLDYRIIKFRLIPQKVLHTRNETKKSRIRHDIFKIDLE